MAVRKTFGTRGSVAAGDKLKTELNDGSSGGWFGNSVAIAGSTAVVGAEFSDSGDGAAYLFGV